MSADSIPALAAVSGATTEQVGRFAYDVPTQTWWWSDSIYRMHGFAPGEVVPTTDLMLTHQHAEDRAQALEVVTSAIEGGLPFSSRHRIVDAQGRTRTVVSIGEGVRGVAGLLQLRGYFIDVTESLQRDLDEYGHEAVERSAEFRAAIEQAKGALMVTYGIDDDEAFALLRWQSQQSNIKVRDLAAMVTEQLAAPEFAALTPAATIGSILGRIADDPSTAA
jgi:ANTAR domain/PAS fold